GGGGAGGGGGKVGGKHGEGAQRAADPAPTSAAGRAGRAGHHRGQGHGPRGDSALPHGQRARRGSTEVSDRAAGQRPPLLLLQPAAKIRAPKPPGGGGGHGLRSSALGDGRGQRPPAHSGAADRGEPQRAVVGAGAFVPGEGPHRGSGLAEELSG